MRFKPNQKVVCIATGKWIFSQKNLPFWKSLFVRFMHGFGPKYNEVVTVDGYGEAEYLYLREYRHRCNDGSEYAFNENAFEPLMTDDEFEKAIEATIYA